MDQRNPLWNLNWGGDEALTQHLLTHVPEGGVADLRWAWGIVERLVTRRREAEFLLTGLSMVVPPALDTDSEGRALYRWLVLMQMLQGAVDLASLTAAACLELLELALIQRSVLGSAIAVRSLLEHSLVLDRLVDAVASARLGDTLAADGALARAEGPPMKLCQEIHNTYAGTRLDYDGWHPTMTLTEIKKSEAAVPELQRAKHVQSMIERRERRTRRHGILAAYHQLSDVAHPSRGSREVMYFGGSATPDGLILVRRYELRPPSEEALADRLGRIVARPLVEVAHVGLEIGGAFAEDYNRMNQWTREAIVARGVSLELVSRQEIEIFVRQEHDRAGEAGD